MSREVGAALSAFGMLIVAGPACIRVLRAMGIGQSIRTDGPATHHKKAGVPTMGGIAILLATAIATLVFGGRSTDLGWVLLMTLGFGAVGLVDDFIKAVAHRSLGLRARHKLLVELVLAALLGLYVAAEPGLGPVVRVPFAHAQLDLGLGYVVFAAFVVVGASNGVNLTDGLDGLAAGTVAIAALTYAFIAARVGSSDLAVFASALAGACIGFSWFNTHPAQVIMGDTGALALGAALGTLAILTKTELLLAVIGGVFVLETLSDIIQVAYFRLTHGRRVFRMSPLHHHFELSGWQEPKVVTRFWILGIVFSVLGVLAFRAL